MTLDEVISEYSAKIGTLSEREAAKMESRIWALYSMTVPKTGMRREWFKKKFGGAGDVYEVRAAMDACGDSVDYLWSQLEDGMTLYTAKRILTETRAKAALENLKLSDAIKIVVDEYNSLGQVAILPNGKKVMRYAIGKSPKRVKKIIEGSKDNRQGLSLVVNAVITDQISKICAEENVDIYAAKQAKEELEEWIDEGLKTFKNRIAKMKGDAKETALYSKIGKTRFTESLEVLGLKSAEFIFGKPIKPKFKTVKKAYFTRVRPLHPDKNAGSTEKIKEYHEVNKAFKLIQEYAEQVG